MYHIKLSVFIKQVLYGAKGAPAWLCVWARPYSRVVIVICFLGVMTPYSQQLYYVAKHAKNAPHSQRGHPHMLAPISHKQERVKTCAKYIEYICCLYSRPIVPLSHSCLHISLWCACLFFAFCACGVALTFHFHGSRPSYTKPARAKKQTRSTAPAKSSKQASL